MENAVTILKDAGITELEETANKREQLGKHISAATNNRRTRSSNVFCWVYPKPTYQEAKMIVLIQTSVSLRLL
jgi:hypothetical protein